MQLSVCLSLTNRCLYQSGCTDTDAAGFDVEGLGWDLGMTAEELVLCDTVVMWCYMWTTGREKERPGRWRQIAIS